MSCSLEAWVMNSRARINKKYTAMCRTGKMPMHANMHKHVLCHHAIISCHSRLTLDQHLPLLRFPPRLFLCYQTLVLFLCACIPSLHLYCPLAFVISHIPHPYITLPLHFNSLSCHVLNSTVMYQKSQFPTFNLPSKVPKHQKSQV